MYVSVLTACMHACLVSIVVNKGQAVKPLETSLSWATGKILLALPKVPGMIHVSLLRTRVCCQKASGPLEPELWMVTSHCAEPLRLNLGPPQKQQLLLTAEPSL